MAYRINLTSDSQRITAATIDSSCTPRDRHLGKYTGVTTNNAWDNIVNGDSTPGDTALVLVINANTGSSSRQGYGEIMYNINGTECSTILHLVQEGSGGGSSSHDISITVTGGTSPFQTAYNLYLVDYLNGSTSTMVQNVYNNGVSMGNTSLYGSFTSRNSNCTLVSFSGRTNIVNKINSSGQVTSSATPQLNTAYYVIAIEAGNPNNYRVFGKQASFKDDDSSCSDVVIGLNWNN